MINLKNSLAYTAILGSIFCGSAYALTLPNPVPTVSQATIKKIGALKGFVKCTNSATHAVALSGYISTSDTSNKADGAFKQGLSSCGLSSKDLNKYLSFNASFWSKNSAAYKAAQQEALNW